MKQNQEKSSEYYTIDVVQILRNLWHRAWIIVLAAMIAGGAGFCISKFVIAPTYSSSILLYVNNSSINLGSTTFSISASDISASQSLVKTYTELLKNRTTLEKIIEKTGVPYNFRQLFNMIEAGSSNDTEVMKVTVTGEDPYEAAEIANCIAEVLPVRIAEIIDGASMEVVDSAIPITQKIAPSITKYTAVGMILGVVLSVIAIAIVAMQDDTIYDEEYILQAHDYPILARIPNLLGSDTKHYGYYRYRKSTGGDFEEGQVN